MKNADQMGVWMHEHPKTALIGIAGLLIGIGSVVGAVVVSNVYDYEMTRMFSDASGSRQPALFNERYYSINYLGNSSGDIPSRISYLPLEPGQWVCGNGSRGIYENECVFIPDYSSSEWLYTKITNALNN